VHCVRGSILDARFPKLLPEVNHILKKPESFILAAACSIV
jgi:hypothetical protein